MQNAIATPNAKQLKEILAAAPDAIALAAGAAPAKPHPLAESLKLQDLAFACGVKYRRPNPIDTELTIAGFGLGTSDFPSLLSAGLKHATIGAYNTQAAHAAFTIAVQVDDFQPADLPALDGDVDLQELPEGAQRQAIVHLTAGGAVKAQIRTFSRKLGLSRASVINNNLDAFARAVIGTGASAARLEARLVAAALEGNPVLDDGAAVFSVDNLNVVAAALDASTLGQAMSCLRKQKTVAGQLADLAARHLVVDPGAELTARQLVREAGLDITVTTLAHLPAGRWYLLAAPETHPVVGTLRLLDSKWPIRVEPARRPENFDGAVLAATADLGAVLLRRTGIVRGGEA
jgi:hypothetical protein